MSPLEVTLLRIVGPAVVVIAARLCARVTAALTVLVVGGLLIVPAPFVFDGERHASGTQALLVIACALLGVSMRLAKRGVRRRKRPLFSSGSHEHHSIPAARRPAATIRSE